MSKRLERGWWCIDCRIPPAYIIISTSFLSRPIYVEYIDGGKGWGGGYFLLTLLLLSLNRPPCLPAGGVPTLFVRRQAAKRL